ncbi:MAG: glycoside hydrolase family 36 protein [bacterium]
MKADARGATRLVVLVSFGALAACGGGSGSSVADGFRVIRAPGEVRVVTDSLDLAYDLTHGSFTLGAPGDGNDGGPDAARVLVAATSEARGRAFRASSRWSSDELALGDWHVERADSPLGAMAALTVTRSGDGVELEQTIALPLGGAFPGAVVRLAATNVGAEPIVIGDLSAVVAGRDHPGGLFPESDPGTLRVLENGAVSYFDFAARVVPGTAPSAANWNAGIADLARGTSVVIGGLSFARGEPLVSTAASATSDGALAVETLNVLTPAVRVAPGERLEAEPLYVDIRGADLLPQLERYADAVRTWLGIVPWTERHPEIGVPDGWNSWTGSSGSGGYGTDIDEQIILANLDVADRELRKWGMRWFQIDDGWQVAQGDWEVRADRFPRHGEQNGIQWLMGEIARRGFRPGVWISPYSARFDSKLVREHPEWVAQKDLVGTFTIDDDQVPLDLTRQDVRAWLDALMRKVVGWGARWIKLDFGYYFLMSHGWQQQDVTRVEAFRAAHRVVRDAIGPDTFFLTVSVVGPTYDLVDANRVTLDTQPVWDGEDPRPSNVFEDLSNQGIKPTVRAAARRWFLHDRVWLVHPDLIFFRSHADTSLPPLTLSESQALAQFVAMSGGIVKLGDKLVDLSPEAIASIRALLPIHGRAARPLDVLTREYPEVESLPVPDFPEPYHVIGLTHWGRNRDLAVNPYLALPDEPRRIDVDLAAAGLDPATPKLAWEFWTESFLGEIESTLSVDVPPHTARAIALRPKLDRPQLLGTNRHVLGGVGVIESLEWDGAARTLAGVQEGSVGTAFAPFVHRLAFHVPSGFAFAGFDVQVPDGMSVEELSTRREPASGGASILRVAFRLVDARPPKAAEGFERIRWLARF